MELAGVAGMPSAFADWSQAGILDHFGVPAARFNDSGRLLGVSESAVDLLGTALPELLQEASALVARLLDRSGTLRQSSPSITLPSHDGLTTLRAQLIPGNGCPGHSLVLFLTARRAPQVAATSSWGLSAREAEVAKLIATGASTKEIAAQLRISVHTARRHTERVFAKLGVQSRSQVVLLLRGTQRGVLLA